MKTARHFRSAAFALVGSFASVTTQATAAFAAGAPAQTDIHDIRGPIAIPYWWIRPALALAALVLLALAFIVYRLLRNRVGARIKSAAELAFDRIDHARALATAERTAEFSAEISNALREYIEARFALRAVHKTTEEFLRDLLSMHASPVAGQREALDDFLSACDLAKFARFALSVDHMMTMIAAAKRFIEVGEASKTDKAAGKPPSAPIVPIADRAATSATEVAS